MTASKWSQKHKQVAKQRKTRTRLQNPFLSEEATLRHLTYAFLFNRKGIKGRCVLNVLVTIPACSHERPERHAHCTVQDDGVPVLHVEPIRARLRQLRVVVQELEQDSDEVVTHARRPSIVDTSKTKSANLGKKDD